MQSYLLLFSYKSAILRLGTYEVIFSYLNLFFRVFDSHFKSVKLNPSKKYYFV